MTKFPLLDFKVTIEEFQELNKKRSEELFNHIVEADDPTWPLQNWALSIAGEAGEFCNLVKKCLRGDFGDQAFWEKRQELIEELADIICYADLAMSALKANTKEEVIKKFNKVTKRF